MSMGYVFGDEPTGEYVECWNCGGKGYLDDLYEVDPNWYDPEDTETCDICKGDGGWKVSESTGKESEGG